MVEGGIPHLFFAQFPVKIEAFENEFKQGCSE
jgi:hypothetical protein